MSAAGPPQGANCSPLGAANEVSVGVVVRAAGPPQGANCSPLGAANEVSVGVVVRAARAAQRQSSRAWGSK
jgi:hypothetical protein